MLTIREIRALAGNLKLDRFARELGPFALIQRPPGLAAGGATNVMGLPLNARATQIARPDRLTGDVLSLLFEFETLIVATLPPLEGTDLLTVGRAADCDVLLDDPSVSKRHATLRWSEAKRTCTLEDRRSTNGTFLNGSIRIRKAVILRDGDIISFGEVPFWYLLTPTLYDRLTDGKPATKTGMRLR
ncbi:MAG TPA: FHA domain-containing protein [Myxococcaceae bacterium]|nr:FHA domain-containing protein [Myxococcaceae bacterium]